MQFCVNTVFFIANGTLSISKIKTILFSDSILWKYRIIFCKLSPPDSPCCVTGFQRLYRRLLRLWFRISSLQILIPLTALFCCINLLGSKLAPLDILHLPRCDKRQNVTSKNHEIRKIASRKGGLEQGRVPSSGSTCKRYEWQKSLG